MQLHMQSKNLIYNFNQAQPNKHLIEPGGKELKEYMQSKNDKWNSIVCVMVANLLYIKIHSVLFTDLIFMLHFRKSIYVYRDLYKINPNLSLPVLFQ